MSAKHYHLNRKHRFITGNKNHPYCYCCTILKSKEVKIIINRAFRRKWQTEKKIILAEIEEKDNDTEIVDDFIHQKLKGTGMIEEGIDYMQEYRKMAEREQERIEEDYHDLCGYWEAQDDYNKTKDSEFDDWYYHGYDPIISEW
jgi:hypothetical protein